MKIIRLSRGKKAIVDDEDYERLSQHRWSCMLDKFGNKYAYRGTKRRGVQKRIYMHREVVKAPPTARVDHRSGDGLDNRRNNLRFSTHAENLQNARVRRDSRSGFRGVTWDTERRKWFASICLNGKTKALGRFSKVRDAVLAWNQAAARAWGEFARLNRL